MSEWQFLVCVTVHNEYWDTTGEYIVDLIDTGILEVHIFSPTWVERGRYTVRDMAR